MNWFLTRMAEPSTWAGIGLITMTVSEHLASGSGIAAAGMAGLLAFLLGERKK